MADKELKVLVSQNDPFHMAIEQGPSSGSESLFDVLVRRGLLSAPAVCHGLRLGPSRLAPKSIGLEPGTEWVADLLARNDTLETVGTITVTAVLLDDEGQEFGRVQGTSDVPEARPGEPVPVRLTSDTATEQVASVKFEANAGPPSGGTERRLRFIVDPNPAPYGHEEPQQRIDYGERDLDAPLPYLECMAVTPTDKEVTVSDVDNVLAWQDGQGRIVYVAKAFPVSESSMTKFGDQTPYCVSVGDPDIAKELMGFATLWWGVGEMS